jgi:hypothetical protein
MEALVRSMDTESWMGDMDLGEMFHNFPLDINLRPYCGIDMTPYIPEVTGWERWVQLMMGLRPSPYCSIRGFQIALESVLGNHADPNNVFHWSKLVLNLPGHPSYDPTKPRVWKFNPVTGRMAAGLLSYVDDLRALGCSQQQCWLAMHHLASKLAYLGIQVAARKTRPPSTTPGPWAGAVAWPSSTGVSVRSTREKWQKAKALVARLDYDLVAYCHDAASPGLNLPFLESTRGFLVHLQQVYPALTPYLKVLHLTIDSWRDNCDEEGWKPPRQSVHLEDGALHEEYLDEPSVGWNDNHATDVRPRFVQPVPRYAKDLLALRHLLEAEDPPLRFVRQNKVHTALYGFVDASAAGFGSSFSTPTGTHYSYGVWGRDQEESSSNYKELNNLVSSVERLLADGTLVGAETFIFTDNFTAESAFYKGNTTSKTLFDLVLRFQAAEMSGLIQLQVIHVAGTRMIRQGTDGLSRGCLTEGVMSGKSMLEFIPLHLSALDRQPTLLQWIRDWTMASDLTPLSPSDWFERGHGICRGTYDKRGLWHPTAISETWLLWSPPPAAADVAVEELLYSRHKRHHLNHVFLVPRLATHLWRKKLYKVGDIVFELPPGSRPFWPVEEHEPLIIGHTLRFVFCAPWQLRQSPSLLAMGRELQGMWEEEGRDEWSLLCKLSQLPATLEAV